MGDLTSLEVLKIRRYLSPRLEMIYEDALKLEKMISRAQRMATLGMLPPTTIREEVINLVERIKSNILMLVKTYIKDESKIEKFEEKMARLDKTTEEYRTQMLKIPMVGDPKHKAVQLTTYLNTYASFYRAYVVPIFLSIARKMAMDESKIFAPIERQFVKEAYDKLGFKIVDDKDLETFGEEEEEEMEEEEM